MYPIILERDTVIINWQDKLAGWPDLELGHSHNESMRMRNDGIVHPEFATMEVMNLTTITAQFQKGVGVNMTPPEDGTEFTPYQIRATASAESPEVMPFLFVGESQDPPTSVSGGDFIGDYRVIAVGNMGGVGGGTLDVDLTIVVIPNPAAAPLCIGVCMMAYGTALSSLLRANVSVRRLMGVAPALIDTRKL